MILSNIKSPAKVILFGEHFVVYGSYGIGAAIDLFTEVNAHKNESLNITFNGKKIDNPEPFRKILEYLNIKGNLKIDFSSKIPKGLGRSASMCVGLVRELNDMFKLNLNNENVNKAAFAGEQVFHGNASGIDNTVITYGGILFFRKAGKRIEHKKIKPKKEIKLIICSTGKQGSTAEMVAKAAEFKEKNEQLFSKYVAEANNIAGSAKKALENGNLETLGRLFNQNQELLKRIGVSTQEIEEIINAALFNGALGAKLTGAGGGGCVIILAKEDDENRIINNLKHLNYSCFPAYII